MSVEYSSELLLTTAGPDVLFNASSGDLLQVNPDQSSGLEGPQTRQTKAPKPRAGGLIVFPGLTGDWPIVLRGIILPENDTTSGRNTLVASVLQAYAAVLTAPGTLSYTPTGGSARSITVYQDPDTGIHITGFYRKFFTIGLLSSSTGWS